MIGLGIAFNPCCKCVEKGMCNICELTYYRKDQLFDSADIAPVRHGYWIDALRPYETSTGEKGISPYRVCSECKYEYPVVTVRQHFKKYKHCPECGAKMDGERRPE